MISLGNAALADPKGRIILRVQLRTKVPNRSLEVSPDWKFLIVDQYGVCLLWVIPGG